MSMSVYVLVALAWMNMLSSFCTASCRVLRTGLGGRLRREGRRKAEGETEREKRDRQRDRETERQRQRQRQRQ